MNKIIILLIINYRFSISYESVYLSSSIFRRYYEGSWKLNNGNLNKFDSNEGISDIYFFYNSDNNIFNITYTLYNGNKKDNNYILTNSSFFTNTKEYYEDDQEVYLFNINTLNNISNEKSCNGKIKLEINDENGNYYILDNPNFEKINIKLLIKSKDCDFNFELKGNEFQYNFFNAFLFTFIQSFFIIFNIMSMYKILFTTNQNLYHSVSGVILTMSLSFDFHIISLNLFIISKYGYNYINYLSIISILIILNIIIKIRILLPNIRERMVLRGININNPGFNAFIKYFLLLGILIIVSFFISTYILLIPYIYFLIFTIPLIQIYYNYKQVSSHNCFIFSIHTPIFANFYIYPIYIKGINNIFKISYSSFYLYYSIGIFLFIVF